MKIQAYILSIMAFLLTSPTRAWAQEELLKFDQPHIDAGTMTEDDAPRTYTFVGRNVSRKCSTSPR